MKLHIIAFLTAALVPNVIAQTPAAAAPAAAASAATPAADPALSKPVCTKPELPDGTKKITEARMKVFVAGLEGYKDCITAFAQSQQKIADQQQKAAQSAVTAANGAIKEYNDFVEQANKVTAAKDETGTLRHDELATRQPPAPQAGPGAGKTAPQ